MEDWFLNDEALVTEMRACHRVASPRPVVRGFRDLVPLQQGGQGAVFVAVQEKDGRQVAVKVFHEQSFETPLVRRRFEREIHLVSRLAHPNIVRLYRFGQTTDGRPYLAMEYVQGLSLDEYVQGRSVDDVLELMLQICDALDHSHRRGVIHRDLKPGNVRVDRDGNARLLDFGLAKPTASIAKEGDWDVSTTGQFLGSLRWASPEQLRGQPDNVDTRTDIYALGLLLFHSLTGRLPYDSEGAVAEIARRIEHVAPERLRKARPDASEALETIILRCLAKDPSRRYPTVGDLARDLTHARAGMPIEARRDGAAFMLRSLCGRHPFAVSGIAAALLALIAFSIVTTSYYMRTRSAELAGQVALAEKEEALVQKREALAQKEAEVEKVAAVNEFLLGAFLGRGMPADQLGDLRLQNVLTEAADRIDTNPRLGDRPGVRADLHVAFAFWFSALPDRHEQAIEHATEALRLYDKRPDEPGTGVQVAWAHEVRGEVARTQGDFESARSDLRAALAGYRKLDTPELSIARLLAHIADCSLALDDGDGVESMLEESLEIFTRVLGEDHRNTRSIREWLTHVRDA